MTGESDLATLLRTMSPALDPREFAICALPPEAAASLAREALGTFRETEGVTLILERRTAQANGLPAGPAWALITLTVHSSLSAVGFLAAVSRVLAEASIPVNAVSAVHHDHLFVPWKDRLRAQAVLKRLSDEFTHTKLLDINPRSR